MVISISRWYGWSLSNGISFPISFTICLRYLVSPGSYIVIVSPSSPALPVLPIRWTYASGSSGISKLITCDSALTSIPLEATSVATSTWMDPSWRAFNACCLLFWDLFPWIASALTLFWISTFSSLLAPCLVLVNTTTLLIGCVFRKCRRRSFLFSLLTIYRLWLTVSTVLVSGAIRISAGLVRKSRARFMILGSIVAEKNKVCTFLGIWLWIFLISLINPISSIRSASSSVKISTLLRFTCFWLIRSRSLPGVAITISTHLRSTLTWGFCPTHQNITVLLMLLFLPYLRIFSAICVASSLVGVRIRLRMYAFCPLVELLSSCVASRRCSIGSENAAVFPVPVWAHQNTSLHSSAWGIACSWIGVGCVYPALSSSSRNFWARPRSLNVVVVVGFIEYVV